MRVLLLDWFGIILQAFINEYRRSHETFVSQQRTLHDSDRAIKTSCMFLKAGIRDGIY